MSDRSPDDLYHLTPRPLIHTTSGPLLPESVSPVTESQLSVGGLDSDNLRTLESRALAAISLPPASDHPPRVALLFTKSRPASETDCMILVAQPGGTVRDIRDFTWADFHPLLRAHHQLQSIYSETLPADSHHLRIFSFNFHAEPITDKTTFAQKVYAQTLPHFHPHSTLIPLPEIDPTRTLPTRSQLSKKELDNIQDPMLEIISRLMHNHLIFSEITRDLHLLHPTTDAPYLGVNFTLPPYSSDHPQLLSDLQSLHYRFFELYNRMITLFADASSLDSSGMPTLHSPETRAKNLDHFLSYIAPGFTDPRDTKFLTNYLRRLNSRLTSGESVAAITDIATRAKTRVFLRSFAYTLSMIEDQSGKVIVNFSPRIFSTGNLLASLGILHLTSQPPDNGWFARRRNLEDRIRAEFAHSGTPLNPPFQ